MKTKHRVFATTAEANAHVPLDGEVFIDGERNALRFGLGSVPGGYEVVGKRVVDNGPGPQIIAAGDGTSGFFGEVLSTDMMDGPSLASALGISQGTMINDTIPWMKFSLDGRILFIPRRPFRKEISWETLYQVGAVYGTGDVGPYPSGGDRVQDAQVTIGNYTFKVRLLKGANVDPMTVDKVYDHAETHGSEWNRLMYPLIDPTEVDTNDPIDPSIAYGTWANYANHELGVVKTSESINWVQESYSADPNARTVRGYAGITEIRSWGVGSTYAYTSWRPVLELVP